jgi:long-chain fatty acid transport protein
VGDSALSQFENPASLTLSDTCRFDFAGQLIFPRVKWTGPIDSTYSEIDMVPLANFGLAMPVNDRLSWGLGVYSKSGLATRFYSRHLLIPFWNRRTGSDLKDLAFSLNVGYKLTDRLSLGAGVRGEVLTGKMSTVLGPVDVDLGRGYAYGGGFQLGLHYQAREDLAFGLAYRSPSWFSDLSGGDGQASLFGFLPIDLGDANIDEFRLPQKITAGVAWDATDWLKLIGEVRWINYANSTFGSAKLATDGPLDLRLSIPLGYRDQWVFIVGAEFKLNDHWTLGVGYNYATNPVPRPNILPICSNVTQHHITLGLRYEQEDWWVGGGYILGLRGSLSGNGSTRIPLGIDYGFSEIEQTQHSFFFGFGFRWGGR